MLHETSSLRPGKEVEVLSHDGLDCGVGAGVGGTAAGDGEGSVYQNEFEWGRGRGGLVPCVAMVHAFL